MAEVATEEEAKELFKLDDRLEELYFHALILAQVELEYRREEDVVRLIIEELARFIRTGCTPSS